MSERATRRWIPIVAAGLAASLVAGLGSTMTDLGPWYQGLDKPRWQPPDFLFPIAWTLIFALAALSAATGWKHAPDGASRETMVGLFSINGFLNILWTALFFRIQRPDWALIEVGMLWLTICALIFALVRYSRLAALLLLPYLAWVSFAAVLNLEIVRLNGPF